MDTVMAISGETVKILREAKAWSQAHLAEAAGLSLRTVQRVEAEGTASAETRLAIAAALDVPVNTLNAAPMPPPTPPAIEPDPPVESTRGLTVVMATSFAGLLFAIWIGSGLPATVASHFGAAGDANGQMSRDQFVVVMVFMLCALPLLTMAGLSYAVKRDAINIPNARFWLAEPRRGATQRWLHGQFTRLCVGLTLFLSYVLWLVAAANRGAPAHPTLDLHWMLGGVGVFLAAMTAWVAALQRRFRRD